MIQIQKIRYIHTVYPIHTVKNTLTYKFIAFQIQTSLRYEI